RLCIERCFFFSSRRRHTRSKRDWSSDVCSSDLSSGSNVSVLPICDYRHAQITDHLDSRRWEVLIRCSHCCPVNCKKLCERNDKRSEERRVGKECRSRRRATQEKE